MAKTDFTKVEERLIEGLRKIFIHRILDMADSAASTGVASEPVEVGPGGEEVRATSREESRKNILRALRRDLKRLQDKDVRMEERLGMTRQEIRHLVDNPGELTPDDWKKIKKLKDQMEGHSKELSEPLEEGVNEKLVEAERIKHINKRFNVREGWLPLH